MINTKFSVVLNISLHLDVRISVISVTTREARIRRG